MIIDQLQNAYLKIIKKHNNPVWAREELEWYVYDKYKDRYDKLSSEDKYIIDTYFSALKKIYGGN